MLIVRESGPFEDRGVRDLPQMLRAGDVLVFNDTRVIPAQLEGRRGEAKIGATLHKRIDLRRWQAFVRNGKRLREGDVITAVGNAEIRHLSDFEAAMSRNEHSRMYEPSAKQMNRLAILCSPTSARE